MPTEQTATVTPLHQQVEHYPSCDRDVYGRAVMHLLSTGAAECITAVNLRAWVRGYRDDDDGRCGCRAMRVSAVETEIVRAKLAWNACTSDANAQRVADLVAKRDALRNAR
jgi:hypothetical protein